MHALVSSYISGCDHYQFKFKHKIQHMQQNYLLFEMEMNWDKSIANCMFNW